MSREDAGADARAALDLIEQLSSLPDGTHRATIEPLWERMLLECERQQQLSRRDPFEESVRGREPERVQNAIARDLRAAGFKRAEILELVRLADAATLDKKALRERLSRAQKRNRQADDEVRRILDGGGRSVRSGQTGLPRGGRNRS